MKYLAENWWYILLIAGFAFMMFRKGGCCGGHSQGGHDHSGHDQSSHDRSGHGHTEQNGDNGQHVSGRMNNQIEMVLDPECGMHVDPETALKHSMDGKTYYFCSETCRDNFVRKH